MKKHIFKNTYQAFVYLCSCVCIIFILCSSYSFAEDASKPESQVKTTKPSKLEAGTAQSFVEAAFPSSLWGFNFFPVKAGDDANKIKERLPFVAEYVLRTKGFPQIDVVNKWAKKEITVGYGWPEKSMSPHSQASIKRDLAFYPLLEPVIIKKIDEINSLGIINLRFIPPEKEGIDNPANIRITGFKWSGSSSIRFDRNSWEGGMQSWYFEPKLQSGVRFSSGSPRQVEGYLLPKADNTIGISACYIKADSSPAMLESYISECLLRSLGLPSIAPYAGILGERTSPETATSITEGDISLLKILYDERIRPGDNKRKVINALSNF